MTEQTETPTPREDPTGLQFCNERRAVDALAGETLVAVLRRHKDEGEWTVDPQLPAFQHLKGKTWPLLHQAKAAVRDVMRLRLLSARQQVLSSILEDGTGGPEIEPSLIMPAEVTTTQERRRNWFGWFSTWRQKGLH